MKTHLFTAIILAVSAATSALAAPKIAWLESDHDFGTFGEEDGPVTCTYRYVNTGDEPLAVASARATCGCTTPKYSTSPLAPGDTATITVSFNPIGRLGRFDKKVYVETNADPARSTLTLHGTVIGSAATIAQRYPADFGALKFRNGSVMTGDIQKGKVKTIFAEAYNSSRETLHPQIVSAPDYIAASVTPEAVLPGEQVSVVLYVRSEKCAEWGLVEDSISLRADPAIAPDVITLPVTAVITEDFSKLTPGELAKAPNALLQYDSLDFGTLDRTAAPQARQTVIVNNGRSKLIVRRVYTLGKGITVAVDRSEIKAGERATLTVTVDPAQLTGAILNDSVTLITNSPKNSTQTIRVVGELN